MRQRREGGPRRVGIVGLTLILAALVSCTDPLAKDPLLDASFQKRLRQIDGVSLAEQSRSRPQTLAEASLPIEASSRPATEPASVALRLEEVRAAALANNLQLKADLVEPSIAQERVASEQAKFEAVFFTDLTLARREPTGSLDESRRNAKNFTIASLDNGVKIPLRTGGELVAAARLDNTDTSDKNAPRGKAEGVIGVSQNLLRGAGEWVNTASIRLAMLDARMVDTRTKLNAIRILAAADRAYWRLYSARGELEARYNDLQAALDHLGVAKQRFKAGAGPEIEIIRAEAGLATRREAILITDTTVKRLERELKRVLNRTDLPMESATIVVPQTPPMLLSLDLDPKRLADQAEANRSELLESEIQLAADDVNIGLEKNAALPLFALDFQYVFKNVGDGTDNAISNLFTADNHYNEYTLGVRGEIPLGNEAAKARVRRAVLQRLATQSTREQRRQLIRQESLDALDQLDQDWKRIIIAHQSVTDSTRRFAVERQQFTSGLRTSTDVLDAAADLRQAQISEVRAIADYQIAQVDVAYATGTLLGLGRIELEPAPSPR